MTATLHTTDISANSIAQRLGVESDTPIIAGETYDCLPFGSSLTFTSITSDGWVLDIENSHTLRVTKNQNTFTVTQKLGMSSEETYTGTAAEVLDKIKSAKTVWAKCVRTLLNEPPVPKKLPLA